MPQAAAGPVANGQAQVQRQQQGSFFMSIVRWGLMYYFITNMMGGKKPTNPAALSSNIFMKGEELDAWLYLTETEELDFANASQALVWHELQIPYVMFTPDEHRSLHYKYHPSPAVQSNGSLWAHVYFARSGRSPNPADPTFQLGDSFGKSFALITYGPPPKIKQRKNLLGKSIDGQEGGPSSIPEPAAAPLDSVPEVATQAAAAAPGHAARQGATVGGGWDVQEAGIEDFEAEDDNDAEAGGAKKPDTRPWVAYMKPNVTINLVADFTSYPKANIPETVRQHMTFDLQSGNYFPTVFVNDFWLLKENLILVNSTVDEVDVYVDLAPLQSWKFHLYIQMEASFGIQEQFGSLAEGESDELKRVFLEGNPYLLGVTMVVSLLHTVFDFLAFKNDISFWKNNKSMEGLSARSVVVNFACQLIVFFYLLDNETSWMIIISSGVGVCIEFWKIGKAMKIEIDRSGPIPLLRFKDRDSYANNLTREYDRIATKYLSYALYPLVVGYAIYSLVYDTHKSWYSWILTSLTGCVYTFGFIMMTPQLFINYKMRSVAHLPWRQMTYKFLNTIIDDLFAFVIKMPTLHRLSVFRDDIVFLIYVYQRWIYPVDKKRVNEFGFSGEAPPSAEDAPLAVEQASGGPDAPAEAAAGPESAQDGDAASLTRTAAGRKAAKAKEGQEGEAQGEESQSERTKNE